jgi:ribose/xylose/arabinose/galactoside ABC-type transport system permease subunit
MRTLIKLRYSLPAVLLAVCVIVGGLNPAFFSPANLSNILLQASVITLVTVGMTFVIILGGIDLSVGSIVALCGIVAAAQLKSGMPTSVAVLGALLTGGTCGAISGCLTGFGKVPPFVSTLGVMSVARGLALLLSEGRSISGFGPTFLGIASLSLGGVPAPVIILAFICVAAYVTLRFTYWGLRVYGIGGNPRAAWLSGIGVGKYNVQVYMLSGILCGLASVVLTSRLDSALPTAGTGYEMDAIAAVVIGGAPLSGGRGSLIGSLFGALLLAVLKNGFTLLNISPYFQQLFVGAIIVIAVLVDSTHKESSR